MNNTRIGINPYFLNAPDSIGADYYTELEGWSLRSFSDGINAGLPDALLPLTDIVGNPRRYIGTDETVDIGPFEYQGEKTITSLRNSDSDHENISYPNPSKDILNLKSSIPVMAVKIFDLQGRLVYAHQENDIRNINIQDLHPDLYIMQLMLNNGDIRNEKIVIE